MKISVIINKCPRISRFADNNLLKLHSNLHKCFDLRKSENLSNPDIDSILSLHRSILEEMKSRRLQHQIKANDDLDKYSKFRRQAFSLEWGSGDLSSHIVPPNLNLEPLKSFTPPDAIKTTLEKLGELLDAI